MKEFCFHAEREFLGALLRPHSPMMKFLKDNEGKLEEITTAAYNAGIQLIQENSIKQEILDTVSQPLVPMENYVRSSEWTPNIGKKKLKNKIYFFYVIWASAVILPVDVIIEKSYLYVAFT